MKARSEAHLVDFAKAQRAGPMAALAKARIAARKAGLATVRSVAMTALTVVPKVLLAVRTERTWARKALRAAPRARILELTVTISEPKASLVVLIEVRMGSRAVRKARPAVPTARPEALRALPWAPKELPVVLMELPAALTVRIAVLKEQPVVLRHSGHLGRHHRWEPLDRPVGPKPCC